MPGWSAKHEKGKLVNATEAKYGGTKPGNVSYTALLNAGSMMAFEMRFPDNDTNLIQRNLYWLNRFAAFNLKVLKPDFEIWRYMDKPENAEKFTLEAVRQFGDKTIDKLVNLVLEKLSLVQPYLDELQHPDIRSFYFTEDGSARVAPRHEKLTFYRQLIMRSIQITEDMARFNTEYVEKLIKEEVAHYV